MNVQHFLTVAFCIAAASTAISVADAADLSDRAFCGLQHTDDYAREANGTSIDEFPWVAALLYKFDADGAPAILCSGTIINRRYVLTAAQCLTHSQSSFIVGVRLGEYHTKNVTDCVISKRFEEECTNATDVGIEEITVHPQYDRRTRANDIALVRIDKRLSEFSDYIRPICLFPKGPRYANIGDVLYISGWGRQFYDGEPAELKKKVNTTLITNENCAKELTGQTVTDNQMCTRNLPTNTMFACQGDAGTPVMFVSGAVPQWHLEGISSWGGRCGFGVAQVHTRVSSYLDWIQESIRD